MSPGESVGPRRLVTGRRSDGVSYFARVEEVEPSGPDVGADDLRLYRIWAADALPVELVAEGAAAPILSGPSAKETPAALRKSTPLPGPNGLRVSVMDMPPGWTCPLHWHDTFDVLWVLDGEVYSIVDDGSEVLMGPGDVCLQHGANHAWRAGPRGARVGAVRLPLAPIEGASPPEAARARAPRQG